jgi:polar amino acid transport system substrate-binding protein
MKNIYLLFLLLTGLTAIASQELIFNTQDFAPFSYEIDGVVSGPGVDIIKAVCAKTGTIKPVFRLYPWIRAQKEVKDGSAHALFLIGKNKEREETLYFSHPLITTEYAFFVLSDNKKTIRKIEDLKGLSAGVYGPSNTATTLEEIRAGSGLIIDVTPDDESAFKKLSNGRVDVVFSNADVGYALIKKLNLKNVVYGFSYKQLKYYIGFSKVYVDKKTVDSFNAAYAALYKDMTIQKILDSYQMKAAALE